VTSHSSDGVLELLVPKTPEAHPIAVKRAEKKSEPSV
jgi:hypothetical protein